MIPAAELRKAVEVLGAAERIAVTCHVGPDGDALGSSLAFAHAARAAGKEAVVAVAGRFEIGDSYGFLDDSPIVPVADFPAEPEVMVVFDVGVPSRLGELAPRAARAGTLVVVDHHPDPAEGFGHIRVIDTDAGAAAQLCAYLIRDLGWPVDEMVALCLLTGIVTDTGRFQYSSTDGAILRVAADLVDAGARPEVIGQAVYESAPFGYLSVVSAVLGRAELDAEAGMVWSVLHATDLEAAGIGYEDADDLIDQLRVAEEAGVAVLLKEVDDGFKVSLRSRGEVDVGAVAAAEGGGGHHNAAGFTAVGDPAAIVERIRARLGG
jgi:phosphoesterase RecJ-like protein